MANTVYSASLIMTADVSQAKAQLEGLQKSINGLLKNSHNSSPLGLTKEINQALSKVADLKVALESAMNVNTGKLDLSKFSASLKASGTDIQGYAKTLQSLGPAGQQAFSQLAQSIMSAEVPLKQTNKLLNDFKITLANTVKWQISHTMIDSLVGAMQHAYGYAQDLNKSLNNIRIVTGYSTDQMAKFAKEANNAAKALSTTTTQYTDASLIYYQQGLDSKAVKERTDATIKMANVTGESAKAVSDYMTAIWNNFDNGSKSLEYYADVMTALGAATASSTDEIAAGLEKFAAVSETVGLSYEYATAALATVTAETRQNADVVGNAFKTLFSRIQGLNLGETMDDGTTLNKYSTALDKVGISIKDTSGEIKAMDVILDELGSKWNTLSNDTQLALAQTVAGVRQYTQLIALMDNWDTFKINLGVAIDAEGALQEQADIYAESWQAAADRVKAAFEDIYDSVLNDEFFIKLTDFFGDLLNVIGNTIDGIGGMGGAFAALGVIVSRVWGKDIGKAISSLTYNPTKAQEEATNLREKTNEALKESFGKDTSVIGQARLQAYSAQADVQQSILTKQKLLEESGKNLTEIEKAKAAVMLEQTQLLGQQVIKAAELKTNSENEARQSAASFMVNAYSMLNPQSQQGYKEAQNGLLTLGRNAGYLNNYQSILTNLQNGTYGEGQQAEDVFLNMKKDMQQLIDSGKVKGSTKKTFEKILSSESMDADEALELLGEELDNTAKKAANLQKKIATMLSGNPILDTDTEEEKTRKRNQQQQAQSHAETVTEELFQQGQNVGNADLEHQRAQSGLNINLEENQETIDEFTGNVPETADKFAALAEAISMCALDVTSLIGLFDVWNNQDMSFGEKLLTTFTTLGTVLPMITTSFSGANKEMLIAASNSIRTSLGFSAVGTSGVAAGAGATAAGTGFGAAAAGLWSLIWPIGLVIAGLTALIGIIYGVSKAIDNSDYTLDEQIENSKQSIDELTDSLEDAKTAAEELGTAFDTYDSAIDKLEECTKGTKEYQDALQAANNAALELIKNNSELDYKIEDGGLIKINPESQKQIEEKVQQAVNQTDWALTKEEYDTKNLELSKQAYEKFDQYYGSAFLDNGQIADLIQRKSENKDLNFGKAYMEEVARSSGYQLLEGQSFSDESTIAYALGISVDAVNGYIEAINKEFENQTEFINSYMSQVEALRKAELTEATSKVTNYLGDKAKNYTSDELTVAGIVFNSDTDKAIQEEMESYQNISRDRVKELLTKYVDDFDKLDWNSIRGTGEDMEFWYQDTEGKTRQISAQTIADLEGAAKAFENIGISIQETTALLQSFGKTSNAMTTFIATGSFNKVKKEDKLYQFDKDEELSLDTVKNSIRSQFDTLDQETKNNLMTLAGIDISAENAWEQYLDSLSQAVINDEEAIRDIWSNVYNTDEIVNSETFSGLSYDTQKALSKALNEAFKRGGKEAQETLNNTLSTILSNNEGLEEEIMSIFNSIDWDNIDAWEQFNQQVLAIGGNLNGISKEPFVSVMAAIANSLPIDEIDTLISKLKELYSELGKVKAGDIISIEDLQKYRENGVDIQGYETAEGFRITKDPDLTQVDTQDYETQAGLYNYIASDEDSWVENMQNKYGGFVEQAAAFNNKNANTILQSLLRRYSGDQLTQLKEQLGIGGIEDITTLNTDDSVEALRKFDSLYDKGQDGKFESGYIDQMRLTSYTNLNDLSKDKAFDFSNEATQNALQDYAYDGGEDYADAVEDYQKALEAANEAGEDATDITKDFYDRLKRIENNKAAKKVYDLAESLDELGDQDKQKNIGEIQKELEKVFGKEISEEYIKNHQQLIKEWAKGNEEATKQIFSDTYFPEATDENIEKNLELNITNEDATNQIAAAIDQIPAVKDFALNIMGTGHVDLSQVQSILEQTGLQADTLASLLLSICQTSMDFEAPDLASLGELPPTSDPEAVIEYLQKFCDMLLNDGFAGVSNYKAADADEKVVTGSNGGGGGGSGKSTGDSLKDTIDKRKERRRELLHLKQEGLNPEDASKYYQEEIDLIEEENELLEEQIDMYKEQLPEAVEDFNSLVRSKGFGEFQLILNDDGTVANLDSVLADLQAKWDYAELMNDTDLQNNLDEIYNALMGPLGIQENIDENVALIAKNEKEQAQLALEDIVNRIDWRIKQIDYQIEKLNYYQEKLLIQAHGNKQTIEAMLEGFQYQEQEMLQLFEKGATLRQGIDELIAAKAQYPDYAQMFDEQILEYQSDLIDVNMDILELRAEMEELIQNVLELALDEMDIQNERIDRYVSMLDRFQNIIDLSGRSILDQSLKVELGVAKLDTLINKMSISKQTMEGLAEATKLAQEALAKRTADSDETSVSFWENQVEMLEIELEKAQDDFLTNWEEVLEAAADIFDMRVELTVQTLEQALSPFSSLSVLEDRYNKEKDLQEKYLDDATKLYELNKLNRQVNQSITDENDLLAKSKLRDIQEEILAYQKAGVQMSQYDLDILQKKYDLRLAEIALMEAQNSKTSMRLIRDAAGNWTYAYDADQTAIDEALQSVEDATYELQKASTDYIDEMTEEMISIKQEFVEAIGDLDRNSTDYTEQLLYLQQHYMKEYNAVLGEFQKGVENTGLTIHDTWYGATLDLYNFEDAQKHFSDASDLAISELMVNYKDWQKVVEQAMGVAGTSWESFGDDTGATLDSLEEHIQALCDEISKLVDVLMEYVAMSIGMVEEWQSKYSKQVDAELARNEAYMEMPGHGGNAGSGGGSRKVGFVSSGDISADMTAYIALYGQAGLDDKEFLAMVEERNKKISESEQLQKDLASGKIISTDSIINVLTDTTKSEQALGSDVINVGGIYYNETNYIASQNGSYTQQAIDKPLYDFIQGELNQQGAGSLGGLSRWIPSPSYDYSSFYKKNNDVYNEVYNPRSGWCSKWVGDVLEYNGDSFIRGNAWDAVKWNGGTSYKGQYISNGTVVGSEAGEYGHIGIYQDGYIYATSYSGNSLDRYTIDEWKKKYGNLYVTNAGSAQSGQTALSVFNREGGNTYGGIPLSRFLESGLDNNILKQNNPLMNFITGYDTGGYTGTWGPYGRLALLHEKELVLNKADTSNILDAVKISRGVDDKISDMIAFTNNSLRDLLSYIKLPIFETQPIEQKVEIQAEFPGITDRYELQEALSNLSNDASQYLNIQRNFW